jgi:hypothetical protein
MFREKQKLPPLFQLVLFDFLRITEEEDIESNPAYEPLLLPEWAT